MKLFPILEEALYRGRMGGDFFSTFPASFVDFYNPLLRNTTKAFFECGNNWAYGPIQHLITLPLTFLNNIYLVYTIWFILNSLFLATSCFMLCKILKSKLPIIVFLTFIPMMIALREGVIEIFEMTLIIYALWLDTNKKEYFTGVVMGIATMCKFLPIIFLPYYLISKKFKTAVTMFLTIVFIVGITQLTLGWQNNHTLKLMSKEKGSIRANYRSQTLLSAVKRRMLNIKECSWFVDPY